MAPPSVKPRLSGLTADSVASEAAVAAFHHTQELVRTLLAPAYAGVPDDPAVEELCRQTHVYKAVWTLAQYAISGMQAECLTSAFRALKPLWSSALGDGEGDAESCGEPELTTPLGVVLCAAKGRQQLERAQPLSAVQLAALGSVTPTQIRVLCRNGKLAARDGWVAPLNARQWLARRRVAGFDHAAVPSSQPERRVGASGGLGA